MLITTVDIHINNIYIINILAKRQQTNKQTKKKTRKTNRKIETFIMN